MASETRVSVTDVDFIVGDPTGTQSTIQEVMYVLLA